ncbi:hypothetical protein LTR94_023558, partial [Friedmanniomyces endolithicus]
MDIRVLGLARDLRTNTPVVYAQLPIEDYLEVVGDEFENFTIQRRRENHKAYQRLKVDIAGGALLPSITLAVKPDKVSTIIPLFEEAEADRSLYEKLATALSTHGQVDILDGLQRTYIITDLKKEGVDFVKERDNSRRTKAKKFALAAIVSAYQAFITGSAELQKGNVIANQLLEANALDATEEEITSQFEEFTRWLTSYAGLDECVTRVYKSANVPLEDVPPEDAEPTKAPRIHGGAYANWLATENVIMAFFAAVAQYGGSDPKKKDRVQQALNVLLQMLTDAGEGDDPLGLEIFEKLRVGTNPRRINNVRAASDVLPVVEGVDPSTAASAGEYLAVSGLVAIPITHVNASVRTEEDLEFRDEGGAQLGTICFSRRLIEVDPSTLTRWQYVAYLADVSPGALDQPYTFQSDYLVLDEPYLADYAARYMDSAPLWGKFSHVPTPPLAMQPPSDVVIGHSSITLPTAHHRQAFSR